MVWIIALGLLVYGIYRTNRNLLYGAVSAIVIYLILISAWQFYLWQSDGISQYLLPPYNNWNYFIFYAFTRFWAPYLISGIIGLVAFLAFGWLNKIKGGRFFYKGELYLMLTAIFLSGHPGWIIYFPILFLMMFVVTGWRKFLKLFTSPNSFTSVKVSFYYFWLPAGIITILLNQWLLINWEWYLKLML